MDSIASEQVKGTIVTVEMVKATKPSIHVRNVTADGCNKKYLEAYFSSDVLSGGGEVESVEILSETEAIITFSDPAGIYTYIWSVIITVISGEQEWAYLVVQFLDLVFCSPVC